MDDEIRRKILTLLDQHRIMTIATLRPDGWPQATTVGYVNAGLVLYFLCGLDSQKARNLARDDRMSLTIDDDTADLMAIMGLSMAAHGVQLVVTVCSQCHSPASPSLHRATEWTELTTRMRQHVQQTEAAGSHSVPAGTS